MLIICMEKNPNSFFYILMYSSVKIDHLLDLTLAYNRYGKTTVYIFVLEKLLYHVKLSCYKEGRTLTYIDKVIST